MKFASDTKMSPLGTIFRSNSNKPPKIDQHSLFTSIQVSIAILEGDLQIYEPWKKKRSRPKECHVTLYANETSPFLVWYKIVKSQRSSLSESPTTSSTRPRCVISVSRAALVKTAGGSFELTDFASKLKFRFVAKTIREAETWVEKLAEESLREANLDMTSVCSSRSSFSSISSALPSPEPKDSKRLFSFSSVDQRIMKLKRTESNLSDSNPSSIENVEYETCDDKDSVFVANDVSCRLRHASTSSETFPGPSQSGNFSAGNVWRLQQQHMRAQPHLGFHVALDKHRPDLRSVINELPEKSKVDDTLQSKLPLSEFFVNVPNC